MACPTTLAERVERFRLSLFEAGKVVAFYPSLVDICGGNHRAALVLCQLLYWTERTGPNGWVFKTDAGWKKELGVTRDQLVLIRQSLKARGFLEDKRQGLSQKLHYRLNLDALEQAVRQVSAANPQIDARESRRLNRGKHANQSRGQPQNETAETLETYKEAENTTESTSQITSGDVAFIQDALAPYGTPASQHQAEKLIQECRARVPGIMPEEIGYFIRQVGRTARNARSPMGAILRTVPRDCVTPETVSELRSRRAKERARKNEQAQSEAQGYAELERELEIPRAELLKRRLDHARQVLAASPDARQRQLLPGMIRNWERELRELEGKGTSEGVRAASNARGGRYR